MKKTFLLLFGLTLGLFAKAQTVEMVANSITQVSYTTDSTAFVEAGTNPSSLTAGKDFIVYTGRLNYYEYYSYSSLRQKIIFNTGFDQELYLSKGTEETTYGIEINDSAYTATDYLDNEYTFHNSSSPTYLFSLGDKVYFWARSKGYDYSNKTYSIDANGDTAFVADWSASNGVVVDGVLYSTTGGDRAVCTWDGVNEQDTFPNMDGVIDNSGPFVVFGKYLLLDADLYSNPDAKTEAVFYNMETGENWMYDINTKAKDDGNPSTLTPAGDKVFFTGEDANAEYYMYLSDGTPEGTGPVSAINDFFDGSSKYNIAWYGDTYFWEGNLYFTASDTLTGGTGRQVYQYNLEGDSIHRLTSFMVDGEYVATSAYSFIEFDGMLYFSGSIDYVDYLCRTDGDTVEVVDTVVTDVDELVEMGGKLYFVGEMPGATQYNDTSLLSSGSELMVYTPVKTAVSRVNEVKTMSVYPNPTTGVINIGSTVSADASFEVFDLSGKRVKAGLVGNGRINMNVNKGVYMIRVIDGSQQLVSKVMVK